MIKFVKRADERGVQQVITQQSSSAVSAADAAEQTLQWRTNG